MFTFRKVKYYCTSSHSNGLEFEWIYRIVFNIFNQLVLHLKESRNMSIQETSKLTSQKQTDSAMTKKKKNEKITKRHNRQYTKHNR